MERFVISDLNNWVAKDRRKPLLLRGARQAGKTWLVEKLAETSFNNFVKIDFEENSNIIALTPEACYLMDEADVRYSILEDYPEFEKSSMEEKDFFISYFHWFKIFDNFLLKIFPYEIGRASCRERV